MFEELCGVPLWGVGGPAPSEAGAQKDLDEDDEDVGESGGGDDNGDDESADVSKSEDSTGFNVCAQV